MAPPKPATSANLDNRIRATALSHARSIEEKKKLQAHIADLVLEAFDLPSNPDADPASPSDSDLRLFKECLSLFQSSDLDDLIRERNIDDRCGYALCPKPNQKANGGGEKIWNRKGGKDFALLDRAEFERWCSKECGERTIFVRAQLSKEAAWLRQNANNDIKLLDEMRKVDDLEGALEDLVIADSSNEEIVERLKALSIERGELNSQNVDGHVSIVERDTGLESSTAQVLPEQESIEGHQPKQVKFATKK